MQIYDSYALLQGGVMCVNFELRIVLVGHLIRPMAVLVFVCIGMKIYQTNLSQAVKDVY